MNLCRFCGKPSTLLCDGRIYDLPSGKALRVPMNFFNGKTRTCDLPICRSCAGEPVTRLHLRTNKGCRWDTRDLCTLCRAAQERPVEVMA